MNQDDDEQQELNPGQMAEVERNLRENFVYFRIQVGTPWDNGQFLAYSGKIPRSEFIFRGRGALGDAFLPAAMAMEDHIRDVLIPSSKETKPGEKLANTVVDTI